MLADRYLAAGDSVAAGALNAIKAARMEAASGADFDDIRWWVRRSMAHALGLYTPGSRREQAAASLAAARHVPDLFGRERARRQAAGWRTV